MARMPPAVTAGNVCCWRYLFVEQRAKVPPASSLARGTLATVSTERLCLEVETEMNRVGASYSIRTTSQSLTCKLACVGDFGDCEHRKAFVGCRRRLFYAHRVTPFGSGTRSLRYISLRQCRRQVTTAR